MAKCIYCDVATGNLSKSHYECDQLKDRCNTPEEFLAGRDALQKQQAIHRQAVDALIDKERAPGTQRTIMWGVFRGLCLYTLVVVALGLVFGLIRIMIG